MFASLIFIFTFSSLTFAKVDAQNIKNTTRDQGANSCLLPPDPEHGKYTFSNYLSAKPEERYLKFDISCEPGYKIENDTKSIFCFNGDWSASMPICVRDIQVSSLTFAKVDAQNIENTTRDQGANSCLLPPDPEHGKYTFSNYLSAKPEERYLKFDISCEPGYKIENDTKSIFCFNGDWSASMPICVRDIQDVCTLPTDDLRVEYRCLSFPVTHESWQECKSVVPSGAVVKPICRSPAYFSFEALSDMHCRNGTWNYNPICKPACGLTTQHRQLEGTSIKHVELPWQAVIYGKWSNPYEQFCGGSLITDNKIISAAFCFYKSGQNEELRSASDFVVAVNKMYRPYNDPRDKNSQHSDVDEIKTPSDYVGPENYENNIAIVIVKTPFFFHLSVRPVCIDFDYDLDKSQLIEGNSGKTVRWSTAGNKYQSSEVLNVVDLPYMKNEDCGNILPTDSPKYLTKDRFCTRYNNNGSRLGKINFGNGLAFLEPTTQRFYLHGVLAFAYTAPEDKTMIIAYTSIIKHERFIKQYLLY